MHVGAPISPWPGFPLRTPGAESKPLLEVGAFAKVEDLQRAQDSASVSKGTYPSRLHCILLVLTQSKMGDSVILLFIWSSILGGTWRHWRPYGSV